MTLGDHEAIGTCKPMLTLALACLIAADGSWLSNLGRAREGFVEPGDSDGAGESCLWELVYSSTLHMTQSTLHLLSACYIAVSVPNATQMRNP